LLVNLGGYTISCIFIDADLQIRASSASDLNPSTATIIENYGELGVTPITLGFNPLPTTTHSPHPPPPIPPTLSLHRDVGRAFGHCDDDA